MAVNTDLLVLQLTAYYSEIINLKQIRGNMSGYSTSSMIENYENST